MALEIKRRFIAFSFKFKKKIIIKFGSLTWYLLTYKCRFARNTNGFNGFLKSARQSIYIFLLLLSTCSQTSTVFEQKCLNTRILRQKLLGIIVFEIQYLFLNTFMIHSFKYFFNTFLKYLYSHSNIVLIWA